MSGHIYYRFKAQKEFQRIMFDGIGISVWDLKREIIQESKMGKGSDFDFAIYNADTEEEYANDHTIIPRSSSVIARRLPPRRPGHGNAQMYIDITSNLTSNRSNPPNAAHADWRGGGSISKDFRQRSEAKLAAPAVEPVQIASGADSEAESMAAMFAAQDQQWQKTQEAMATATRVGRNMGFRDRNTNLKLNNGTHKSKDVNTTENGQVGPGFASQSTAAPPPQGYICYRCGQKGHWIQTCPTNDNPEFEGRPRIKRTTGIPKSFLQKVEGKPGDGQNVMVTADGSFVIAKPDDASWKQHKSVVVKNLSAADIENQRPSDPDLACSICSTLLKSAVKMVCCKSTFCQSCITSYLKDHSSVCPECETKVSNNLIKAFVPDEERRTRSRDYVEEMLKASKGAADESDKNSAPEEQKNGDQKDSSSQESDSKSNENKSSTIGNSKDQSGSENQPGVKAKNSAPVKEENEKVDFNSNQLVTPTNTGGGGAHKDFGRIQSPIAGVTDNSQMMLNMGMVMGMNMGPMMGMGMENQLQQHPMMMNKGMDPMGMMMGAGVGTNHNVVMDSKQMGMYSNSVHPHSMGMDMMGNSSTQETMLGLQINQMTMMIQNGQMNDPMRMQMMNQLQQLQNQLSMLQRMRQLNSNPMMMDSMGMLNDPGMMMNGGGGNFVGNFQMPENLGHLNPNNSNNMVQHPIQSNEGFKNFQGSNNHQSFQNHNHHQNHAGTSNPIRNNYINNNNNNNNINFKRKRSEDLIELESGEKVPRYM
ncbi:hypothetical protein PPACK8108_LOCUS26203 [Phakopsora pachyrhizi]|uniref:Uncharacterized protein n=1 Tax=Phakopsora pachyrhizi TaxID=170000 RepID=A0AAV0BX75_PHAPC|nr:hypothetical protein PPACK8108_LOCUS26203 [Phakopsora pachyrhizi]